MKNKPKYNVLMDTNIYRKDPLRNRLHFIALSRLAKAGVVKIYLPFIVAEEFRTYRHALYLKEANSIRSALGTLLRNIQSVEVKDQVQNYLDGFVGLEQEILSCADSELKLWLEEVDGEFLLITQTQTEHAWKAYFDGEPPFSERKNREDIPDSFIFQAILDLYKLLAH